jgi:pyrimidine deaminase RibD-like protein
MVLDNHKKDPEYWGMVGACLLGNKNNPAYGCNHLVGGGLRDHAEVAAYKNYIRKWGRGGLDGAIMITTLSPCSSDIDQPGSRNCTEYINRIGIKKVYCGFKDPTEVDTDAWHSKRFHIMETRNTDLRRLCRGFASTFLDLD